MIVYTGDGKIELALKLPVPETICPVTPGVGEFAYYKEMGKFHLRVTFKFPDGLPPVHVEFRGPAYPLEMTEKLLTDEPRSVDLRALLRKVEAVDREIAAAYNEGFEDGRQNAIAPDVEIGGGDEDRLSAM